MTNKTEDNKAHEILDWVLNFLKDNEGYDVLPNIEPGQIYNCQEKSAPEEGDFLENVFSDFEKQVLPGITHWNHPGFSVYFNKRLGNMSQKGYERLRKMKKELEDVRLENRVLKRF